MVVYNNRSGGKDAQLLKRFKEPAWNYQVLRFLDEDAKDILPRKDRVWTIDAVSRRLVSALNAANRPVPQYLQSLLGSSSTKNQKLAAFAMYCFWTGEHELGKIDGVTATEAGWLDGREVTLVRYNSAELSLDSLAKQAAKVRCAEKMYTPTGGATKCRKTRQIVSSRESVRSKEATGSPTYGPFDPWYQCHTADEA